MPDGGLITPVIKVGFLLPKKYTLTVASFILICSILMLVSSCTRPPTAVCQTAVAGTSTKYTSGVMREKLGSLIQARHISLDRSMFLQAAKKKTAEMSDSLLVLQDADSTDIYQISRNWKDLVKRARSKQLTPDEYNSGNFTISNLGMFGADTFDAILPPGKQRIQMHTSPLLSLAYPNALRAHLNP